jgi:hypothetical protein
MLDTVGIACDEAMSPRMVPVADAVFGVQKFNQDSWGVMASIEGVFSKVSGYNSSFPRKRESSIPT